MTTRTKAVFGIVGVFLLGGVCGALILGIVVRDRVREARNLREREGFSRFFFDRLQLSDAQNDSLRGVIDSAYRQLEQLRQESSQRYAEVIDTLRSRVYPRLTSEQRQLFEEQERRMRAMVPPIARPRGGVDAMRGGHRPPPFIDPHPPFVPPQEPSSVPPATLERVPPRHDTSSQPRSMLSPPDTGRGNRGALSQLNLSDAQKQSIRSILREQGAKIKEMKGSDVVPAEKVRAARELRREGMKRILDVLTPEQREQFRALRHGGRMPKWWKELEVQGDTGN